MTISEKEIKDDFSRFLRHEAMRANCLQNDIMDIVSSLIAKRQGTAAPAAPPCDYTPK